MQPAPMILQHFADDSIETFCKTADTNDESTIDDEFTKGIGSSIQHGLRDYCASHPHAGLTNNTFHANSFLGIQKAPHNILYYKQFSESVKLCQKKFCKCAPANNMNTRTTTSPTCGTCSRSRSSSVFRIDSNRSQTTVLSAKL